MHKIFNPSRVPEIYQLCTTAGIGCVECKQLLAEGINRDFEGFRERRRELESLPGHVEEVLAYGAERARAIAQRTLDEVYQRMGLA